MVRSASPRPMRGPLCERVRASANAGRGAASSATKHPGTAPSRHPRSRREATNATHQRPSPLRGIPALLYRGSRMLPQSPHPMIQRCGPHHPRVISPTNTSIASTTRQPPPGPTIGAESWSSRSTATAEMAPRTSSTAEAGSTGYAATLSGSASPSNERPSRHKADTREQTPPMSPPRNLESHHVFSRRTGRVHHPKGVHLYHPPPTEAVPGSFGATVPLVVFRAAKSGCEVGAAGIVTDAYDGCHALAESCG